VKNNKKSDKTSKRLPLAGLLVVLFFAFLVHKDVSLPSWVLLGGALLGFLYLFLKSFNKPELATYVLVCYVPFSKILVGDFGGVMKAFNFTNILMIFAFLGMLTQLTAKGKRLIDKNSLNIPIFLFCFITGLSFIKGTLFFGHYLEFMELASQLKRWLTPPLLFYIAYNTLRDKKSLENVVKIIMVAVAVVGIMAIVDYINLRSYSSLERSRIGGISDQPNQLAGFFCYYMFLYAGFFLVHFPSLSAFGYLIPMAIAFRGIMVTFSRGGYLSFAVGAYAISFFRSRLLFILVILCSIVMFLNPHFLPAGIRYRMNMTFEDQVMGDADLEQSLEASASRRIVIWKTALIMIKDKPWLGFGYGTFPTVVGSYNPELGPIDAHNSYIIIAAEMGVPALLAFLLIIGIFLKETWWLFRRTKDKFFKSTALGMLGGTAGLLAVNMFGSRLNTLEISGYFWILAAIILRMKSIELGKKGKLS